MQNELLIAIIGGLGAMVGWGLADFFAKITIDEIGDIPSLAWGHITGTTALLLMAFYSYAIKGNELHIPSNPKVWILLILFGIIQATIYLFVYKGFAQGPVGVLSPIFASFSGITALLSIIIFREQISANLIIGLAVLFFGILLINVDISSIIKKRLSFIQIPGLKEIGLATVLAAIWTLFWDRFLGGQNWLLYTFLMYAFMTITILIVAKIRNINLGNVKPAMWKFLILIGICETAAYLFLSWGYSVTSFTSVVAITSGAFALPTIILAKIFLKEKITSVQTLGSIIIIIGIIIIAAL